MRVQLLFVIAVTFFAYSNIFQNDFVIDDSVFIAQWQEVRSPVNIPFFFQGASPPGHEGVYRPVRSVLYAVYYQLFGTNPLGWHVQSLVVHLASTVLVYFIVEKMLEVRSAKLEKEVGSGKKSHFSLRNPASHISFLTSLLFGLHPIHTETITYIASSMDAIGIVFFFGSFYLYLRRNMVASIVLALLAFFTNELTLTLPLLIILYEFTSRELRVLREPTRQKHQTVRYPDSLTFRRSEFLRVFRTVAPYFIPALVYVFVRFVILGITTRGPYLADSVYLTVLTMTRVFVKYISVLILPINQANNHAIGKGIEAFVYRDYRTEAIVAQTLLDPSILLSVAILAMLVILAIWSFRKHPLITFCIAWFFISLLPVSEIIPQGSMLNERMLYIPSFGFTLLIAFLFAQVLPSLRLQMQSSKFKTQNDVVLIFAFCILMFFYGYRTYQRNKDWKNEITLWSKDVAAYPTENAYAYYQLGNALVRAGKINEAIPMHERSNQINPKFVLGLGSIALLYNNAGMTDRAEEMYKKAISQNPTFWEGRFNLGNIYVQKDKLDFALEQYRAVLKINPNFAPARQNIEVILRARKTQ